MNDSASNSTQPSTIQINGTTARPSSMGSADFFSGTVVVDGLFGPNEHSQGSGGLVTFTPAARTAWHSHPVGQTLVVVSGHGWVQAWGEQRLPLRPGDVVWIPPLPKRWPTCRRSLTFPMRLRGLGRQLETWLTTRHGATWRFSTRRRPVHLGSSTWDASTAILAA